MLIHPYNLMLFAVTALAVSIKYPPAAHPSGHCPPREGVLWGIAPRTSWQSCQKPKRAWARAASCLDPRGLHGPPLILAASKWLENSAERRPNILGTELSVYFCPAVKHSLGGLRMPCSKFHFRLWLGGLIVSLFGLTIFNHNLPELTIFNHNLPELTIIYHS